MFQGERLSVSVENNIAILSFDAQANSVNTFNRQTVAELDLALTKLEHSDVQGLVLRSAKSSFMVGADVHEFAPVFQLGEAAIAKHLSKNIDNFNRIEDLPFPSVACLNSFTLGGGMELALACDFRIADASLKMGLPETKLGIIPGWGGTVRLPRVAGADTAIEWICSGREHSAKQALKAGVIDAIVEVGGLQESAMGLVREAASGAIDYQSRRQRKVQPLALNAVESPMVFESSKGVVGAAAGRHYRAPVQAIKAMQAATTMAREQALEVELKYFLEVAVSSVARSLVNVFTSDQALTKKAKKLAQGAEDPAESAAVLGAGIMGGGIAYQCAVKKIPVTLKDINSTGIELGLAEAAKLLQKRVEKGRLSTGEMAQALNRIDPTLHYPDIAAADVVIEAVVENVKVKQSVLAEAEAVIDADAVLVSNTSTISITALASQLKSPDKFCGMHFFNPVHAMPLVEVIRGEKTSNQTIATVTALALALGKKPVVVNDCPGFLVNRVLFPYFAGFAQLVRDGVDYQRIDKVMEGWGWPMGPAYLLDVVGLDTAIHAEAVMADGFPDRLSRDYTSAAQTLFEKGMYGQKTQAGFYRYATDAKGRPVKEVNDSALDLLGAPDNSDITDDDIVMRMMIPMVNELARCLDEEVVATAAEADMAMLYGTGFPPHRGGVLFWVDHYGVSQFVDDMQAFAALGPLYQPAKLLQSLATKQASFYPAAASVGD
ncbi:fatty acid oxidation complex subunit alpha FadB [Gilvimarinus sp. SDUM040013]|uniref:enoyl-CoA hydratase n=1 Tax=Gilvimarinus gilvus TaxID=3058038 RepID=A0ABU4RWU1_9GAMM|nr:fatty acid oxidation complex subunit alpha FadB [Gilvimarinus sp. SDUM040013]MDO3385706.1 fatty acid oxidation complex subunit alpha FadB [Gilvimarinus sp. SDUM040013]MDX6849344.1 fatty acid oxidation complex subunit alpha FadB [Gilvimarinus sp. SDUM040013]